MMDPIDYAFCRRNHGFDSNEAVRAWFAQESPQDLRTFSPRFSPVAYLLDNPDVRKEEANPSTHYLLFGHEEGRKTSPAVNLREYDGAQSATRAMPADNVRVAIVLHIYYSSFVPIFLRRLQTLDIPHWDVFISATPEIVADHGDLIRETLGDRLHSLRSVSNRGRNFAPLLVDFARDLVGYDAICHCHSKESRHSGRRQTEWADYLVSALIGAPDVVRRHVNLISAKACDVIAPAPFSGIPPWASHSLSNDATFRRLCADLGLDSSTGFMSYPVGGMFWMSPAVNARLAELHLTHEDFPEEPSHPDGELHHALERLVGRIAGRRLAFYDQITGRYWAPEAVLRAEIGRFSSADDLYESVNNHDIVSFDFFDTLCIRGTGDEEWAKKRVEFVLDGDYVARRNGVEARLRDALPAGRDVSLTEIAQALGDEGFEDPQRAVALERNLDLATLTPRRLVVQAYEHAIESGKHVVIVSDSYYDKGLISSFLVKYGVTEPKDILTSSDVGARKDRGDLWNYLAHMFAGRRAIHIGDNVHSDIQRAAQHGFATFYVPHWRDELLPFSGLSNALRQRNSRNPAFALSIDRALLELYDDELPKPDLDASPRRIPKRRGDAKNRAAR